MGQIVSQVEEEAIAGNELKTEPVATGECREVKDAKGKSLSKGARIALVLGIGVAVVALIMGYKISHPLSGVNLGKL